MRQLPMQDLGADPATAGHRWPGPDWQPSGQAPQPHGPGWQPAGQAPQPRDPGWQPGGYRWADARPLGAANGYGRADGSVTLEPVDDHGASRRPSDQGAADDAASDENTDPVGHDPVPSGHDDEAWAILGYMSAAILGFGPPLLIYLLKMRSSPFVRAHAVQAVNAAATTFLYIVSVAIVGGMLALDSVTFALLTAGVAVVLLWLLALMYLVKATIAASSGTFYRIPGWLRATFLRR